MAEHSSAHSASALRSGRRKTIVHRTMCAPPENISAGGLTPTADTKLTLICFPPSIEMGVTFLSYIKQRSSQQTATPHLILLHYYPL